jgi:hypothetical protein
VFADHVKKAQAEMMTKVRLQVSPAFRHFAKYGGTVSPAGAEPTTRTSALTMVSPWGCWLAKVFFDTERTEARTA